MTSFTDHSPDQVTARSEPLAAGGGGIATFVVVVPTFNHGHRVCGVLDGLAALSLPVIVVDDGSTDDTEQRLRAWLKANPGASVSVSRHEVNQGKAKALQTGFRAAEAMRATHVVTMDADGQLDASDIPQLVRAAESQPRALVLGARPARVPNQPPRCGWGRRMASLAVRLQCGLRLSDTQCGLRIYPLELVRNAASASERYAWEAEIITEAAWSGRNVVEVPVSCRYFTGAERVSHYRPAVDTFRQAGLHARLIGRAFWRGLRRRSQRPISAQGG